MNRRNFLTTSSLLGAAGLIGVPAIVSACKGGSSSKSANEPLRQPGEYYIPDLPDKAIEGKALKAGVIGSAEEDPAQWRIFSRQPTASP